MGTKKDAWLEKTLKIDYLSSVVIRCCDIFLSHPVRTKPPLVQILHLNPSVGIRSDRVKKIRKSTEVKIQLGTRNTKKMDV